MVVRATRLAVGIACAVALCTLVAGPLASRSPASAAAPPGQVITVQVAPAHSTPARLDFWQRSSKGVFFHTYGPVAAWVGADGVGKASESLARTPAGVFPLTHSFGNRAPTGWSRPAMVSGQPLRLV